MTVRGFLSRVAGQLIGKAEGEYRPGPYYLPVTGGWLALMAPSAWRALSINFARRILESHRNFCQESNLSHGCTTLITKGLDRDDDKRGTGDGLLVVARGEDERHVRERRDPHIVVRLQHT